MTAQSLGTRRRDPLPGAFRYGLVLIAGLGLTGCDALDDLLQVEAPGQVEASRLDQPQHAELMVRSVVTAFECALSAYINFTGVLGNELNETSTSSEGWRVGQRTIAPFGAYGSAECGEGLALYVPLATARWLADAILQKLQNDWADAGVPDRSQQIAMVAAYSGYSHILLGEGMCTVAFDVGPEQDVRVAFERAEARFNVAVEAALQARDERALNLARVGLARALLNLGRLEEAAAVAEAVPEGFLEYATRSDASAARRNLVFVENNEEGATSVSELYRELAFEGVPDPRVPVVNTDQLASDRLSPWWMQTKYTSRDASIPIATWEEAQLILAEARGGQEALDIINGLHDRAQLPHLSTNNHDEIMQHLITEERRRELFLEGHWFGDMRRYEQVIMWPPAGAPYPSGGGGFYGDLDCIPLPSTEVDNNPEIGG